MSTSAGLRPREGSAVLLALTMLFLCSVLVTTIIQRIALEQDVAVQRAGKVAVTHGLLGMLDYGIALAHEMHMLSPTISSDRFVCAGWPGLTQPGELRFCKKKDGLVVTAQCGKTGPAVSATVRMERGHTVIARFSVS